MPFQQVVFFRLKVLCSLLIALCLVSCPPEGPPGPVPNWGAKDIEYPASWAEVNLRKRGQELFCARPG